MLYLRVTREVQFLCNWS